MAEVSPATPMGFNDKQILIFTISAVFIFLTVLGASLRFYSRFYVLRKAFAEDGMSESIQTSLRVKANQDDSLHGIRHCKSHHDGR